jgi:Tol biopolymer transport system component
MIQLKIRISFFVMLLGMLVFLIGCGSNKSIGIGSGTGNGNPNLTPTPNPNPNPTPDPVPSTGRQTKIVFMHQQTEPIYGWDTGDPSGIYIVNADGTERKQLTRSETDKFPVFSPDGKKIAFVRTNSANRACISLMNTDGTGQTFLTQNTVGDDSAPVFSPDGRKIAFVSTREGNAEVYTMNTDGTGQINLTQHEKEDSAPVFSPDGSKIAFTSYRDDTYSVYIMNADGTGQTNLTKSPALEKVFLMNADGSNQKPLTSFTSRTPSFSPDGSKIIFSGREHHYDFIYVINTDGTDEKPLFSNMIAGFSPVFSSDGKHISYYDSLYEYGLEGIRGPSKINVVSSRDKDALNDFLNNKELDWTTVSFSVSTGKGKFGRSSSWGLSLSAK